MLWEDLEGAGGEGGGRGDRDGEDIRDGGGIRKFWEQRGKFSTNRVVSRLQSVSII